MAVRRHPTSPRIVSKWCHVGIVCATVTVRGPDDVWDLPDVPGRCVAAAGLTSASVSSSMRCSVENLRVSDFLPLPLRNVRLNSVPWPLPTGPMPQMSPYGHCNGKTFRKGMSLKRGWPFEWHLCVFEAGRGVIFLAKRHFNISPPHPQRMLCSIRYVSRPARHAHCWPSATMFMEHFYR